MKIACYPHVIHKIVDNMIEKESHFSKDCVYLFLYFYIFFLTYKAFIYIIAMIFCGFVYRKIIRI